jgi:CheY-like chemotaxis protein
MSDVKAVRQATIFLLEDEALIRMMISEMLEELGHRIVAQTSSIQEGKALAETAVFDLALLDVNVAGDSIAPVAEIIAQRGLPFLFVTGYAQSALPEQFKDRPVLQKPFTLLKLKDAIGRIVDL